MSFDGRTRDLAHHCLGRRGVDAVSFPMPNTIDRLTAVRLKHYRVHFPPQPEQHAITAYLARETRTIDSPVGKVREVIDHLQELRTALISAAVTGKIDVRVRSWSTGRIFRFRQCPLG